MKRKFVGLAVGFATICCACFVTQSSAAVGDVVATIPDLTNDNDVGITFFKSHLWVAGHLGTLYEVDADTGAIVSQIKTDFTHGFMGLANDGKYLWVVNHEDGKIYKLDTQGRTQPGTVVTPNPETGSERGQKGLTLQGRYLWYVDAYLRLILKLDSAGTIVRGFRAPGTSPQGLAFDGKYLWHFDKDTHLIYKLDPRDGAVLGSFPTPVNEGEGDLAFDGRYLWFSNNDTKELFKIDIAFGSPPRSEPRKRKEIGIDPHPFAL